MSEVAHDLLYSYKMGIKTLYYANTDDGKTDKHIEEDVDCVDGACKL
jgi:ribonucleoside-diphosphate reductase alpha chain